jgi:hypothetical protein
MTCSSDTLEVGSDVFGINLEGNQYPLDNGDYKLTTSTLTPENT